MRIFKIEWHIERYRYGKPTEFMPEAQRVTENKLLRIEAANRFQ